LGSEHIIDGKQVDCKYAMPKCTTKSSIKERKLFVGGLCAEVSNEEFRKYFEQYGEIEDCIVMREKESGRPRGFGFITFSDEDSTKKVLMNYHHNKIHGKWVDCKRATPKDKIRKSAPPIKPAELGDYILFDMIHEDYDLVETEECTNEDLPAAERIERDIERLLSD